MHWLWDGWPYEWKPNWFIRASSWLGCKLAGHEPISDHCGRPAHDYCAWCSKSMPHQAPRRAAKIRETQEGNTE